MKRLLYAIIFCLFATVLYADMPDGNYLLKSSNSTDSQDNAWFIGYIAAHYELGLMYGYWCYPETTGTVTVNQLMLVVKKWLENNPKVLHEPAAIVTRYALSEAFPCSK